MKSKDSMVYLVYLLSFALLALSPSVIDIAFAPDAPITSFLNAWLENGENFVNSMQYVPGY